jgi:hypothetical protein
MIEGKIFQLQTLYSEQEAIYSAKSSASEVSNRKYNVYIKVLKDNKHMYLNPSLQYEKIRVSWTEDETK